MFQVWQKETDYHTKHCGACLSLKWCLSRILIMTVTIYHCQNPEKLNSVHSLRSVFQAKEYINELPVFIKAGKFFSD